MCARSICGWTHSRCPDRGRGRGSVGTRGHPDAGRGRPEAQECFGGLSPVLRVPAGHVRTAGISRAWPGAPTQGQVGAASTRRVSWSFRREECGAAQVGPWPGCGAPDWLAPDLVKLEPQQLQAQLLARMARLRLHLQATSAPSCIQVQHVHPPWPPWGGAGRGIRRLECEAIRKAGRGGTLKDFLLSV